MTRKPASQDLDLFGDAPSLAPPSPLGARPPAGDEGAAPKRVYKSKSTKRVSMSLGDLPTDAAVPERQAPSAGHRVDDTGAEDAEHLYPGSSPRSAITVATLTQTTKDVLEGAFLPLWVRGEISDFKRHRNGHWYFCLRDATAQIKCVVWSRDQRRIPAPPDDGMQVTALGQLTVYAARGDLQLTVKSLEAEGDGLWRKALELTRQRLEADGLLDPARRRAIPRFPRRIAIVTSPDGAALHDIVAVVRRRAPHVELVVVPAKVQGEGAPEEICAALARVARWGDCDVVIVGRGGGGREDLWAFNDERVARAVAMCPIPTISAVGHEVDITICDLVADLRAPTPSAAAEAAVPMREELLAALGTVRDAMVDAAARHVQAARTTLAYAREDLVASASRVTERAAARLTNVAGRLDALSPLATLGRGYALATDPSGAALTRAAAFTAGAPFALRLRDGIVDARVESVRDEPLPVLGAAPAEPGSPRAEGRGPRAS